MAMHLTSELTCPHCGHKTTETMPVDSCLWFFECPSCRELLSPQPGDCCVFCSYGDRPCPPIQELEQTGEVGDCCPS
ncbi:GDCCVxC domain-containing (seleno)protein [Guyparkeria sp. GHLCS8-2]|uniref:GDCCVxC domain-containing (seleno)protein n=1 Tax=Guyparkeria halopsychrophila TaxID=3139421 RepID=UPI0037CC747B